MAAAVPGDQMPIRRDRMSPAAGKMGSRLGRGQAVPVVRAQRDSRGDVGAISGTHRLREIRAVKLSV
jgi:hypothetical protein